MAWLGGSDLGVLVRLLSKCQPGPQSSLGLTAAQGPSSKMVYHSLKVAHSYGYWLDASVPSKGLQPFCGPARVSSRQIICFLQSEQLKGDGRIVIIVAFRIGFLRLTIMYH